MKKSIVFTAFFSYLFFLTTTWGQTQTKKEYVDSACKTVVKLTEDAVEDMLNGKTVTSAIFGAYRRSARRNGVSVADINQQVKVFIAKIYTKAYSVKEYADIKKVEENCLQEKEFFPPWKRNVLEATRRLEKHTGRVLKIRVGPK